MSNQLPSPGAPLPNSFWAYLAKQKWLILLAVIISAACFLLLQYCFPLPDFFVDSFNYVLWALLKFDVAYRPTGYSFFLRLTHGISAASFCTVLIQYILFFLSTLFCFLSADYLFGLQRKLKWPLLIIALCNPILLFQTNLISSDSLFCSLTVTWFTLCLWVIKKRNWPSLLLQVLLLYLCFEVRYTALFYPVVAAAVFMVCGAKWSYKITGIALTAAIILFAVQRQKSLNEQETGARIFSGFSGWQIANNALYCYKHLSINTIDLPTSQTQIIDQLVKHFIDSVNAPAVGYAYIWDNNSPLKRYLRVREYTDHIDYFKAWFVASAPMSDYGWYIIRTYPGTFLQHYILPNTLNFLYPDAEILANYNTSNATITPETQEWFHLDVSQPYCRYPDLQRSIISIYPFFSLLLTLFNLLVISLSITRWKKLAPGTRSLLLLWTIFFLSFATFTIFATEVTLRYMNPFYALGLLIPCLLITSLRTPPTGYSA